ncbi:ATP-binding cassette domain-containing protein [Anaerococcus vaginalis]|uniref:ATP-binding cassette domain-containing protein n=1 Tax=Anaerococcus vaginalis TaxID=33037 RepID=UPI0022DEC5CE|nr:ABC transporter ATP-binding protein [Anaerococcus vaginalis]
MKVSKKINTLVKIFKTSDKEVLLYSFLYFFLNLIKLFLLPIITIYVMKRDYLVSSTMIVIYFVINYSLILIKEILINVSNFSRMKRIEKSYDACININYEFFESYEGRNLFTKAVSTTNSTTSPFSKIYLSIFDTLYTVLYMGFVIIYSLKFDKVLFFKNIIFSILICLVIFFDNLNINQAYNKMIELFISKEKNLNYLRKIAKQFEKSIILNDFRAKDLYQDKYNINEKNIINGCTDIKKNMILKLGLSDFCKILVLFIYIFSLKTTAFTLTMLVFMIQFLIVSNKFFDSFFELNNITNKIYYYYKFIEKSESKDKKIYIDELNCIEFKNVYFSYNNSDFSLKNINIKLENNKKIGIFGSNGCGKTTIVKLLLGLYKVKRGEILINGINIDKISNLNELISCVFQDDIVIPASLEENILFGKKMNKRNFSKAMEESSFNEVMKKNHLNNKTYLNSLYVDDAKDLSMGESQLLYLARSIYKNTNMIIWDEPSSNLDPFRELRLFTKYKKIGKDSMGIFISHKASNIKMFDEIIFMENGQIIERGNFKDLMDKKGKYYELYKKQEENFTN